MVVVKGGKKHKDGLAQVHHNITTFCESIITYNASSTDSLNMIELSQMWFSKYPPGDGRN